MADFIPPVAVNNVATFTLIRTAKLQTVMAVADDALGDRVLLRNGATLFQFPAPTSTPTAVGYVLQNLNLTCYAGDTFKSNTVSTISLIFG